MEQWLEIGVPAWFQSNLLPVTKEVADVWAKITIARKKKGLPLATGDGLIAATALINDLTIVTRDLADFDVGADLLSPWV